MLREIYLTVLNSINIHLKPTCPVCYKITNSFCDRPVPAVVDSSHPPVSLLSTLHHLLYPPVLLHSNETPAPSTSPFSPSGKLRHSILTTSLLKECGKEASVDFSMS